MPWGAQKCFSSSLLYLVRLTCAASMLSAGKVCAGGGVMCCLLPSAARLTNVSGNADMEPCTAQHSTTQ